MFSICDAHQVTEFETIPRCIRFHPETFPGYSSSEIGEEVLPWQRVFPPRDIVGPYGCSGASFPDPEYLHGCQGKLNNGKLL